MTVYELLQSFNKGKLHAVYLLFGEERYYARQVEKALIDAALLPEDREMGLQIFDQDPSVSELLQMIESMPFFGGKNVIIIRDTKLFRAGKGNDAEEAADKTDPRLLDCLQHIPDYTHILFVTGDKVDKRRKLYKAVEKAGAVVELVPLKTREARVWVQERLRESGKSIIPEALDYLMTGISFMPQISMGFLDQETQKIVLHSGERQRITLEDIKASIAGIPEINIFAMIDAMSQKNIRLALKLLDEQLATGEPPMRILMLFARQTRSLLYVKELASEGRTTQDIAKSLGLHPFIAEKMLSQTHRFTESKLKQIIMRISDVDRAIKSGRAGNVSLEGIVIEMCKD